MIAIGLKKSVEVVKPFLNEQMCSIVRYYCSLDATGEKKLV